MKGISLALRFFYDNGPNRCFNCLTTRIFTIKMPDINSMCYHLEMVSRGLKAGELRGVSLSKEFK